MKEHINILLVITLMIITFMSIQDKQRTTNQLSCIEYAMIEGLPYCGVYEKNGKLYEITMDDVKNSELIIEIE